MTAPAPEGDIVARLKDSVDYLRLDVPRGSTDMIWIDPLRAEAAAEIERLRAEVGRVLGFEYEEGENLLTELAEVRRAANADHKLKMQYRRERDIARSETIAALAQIASLTEVADRITVDRDTARAALETCRAETIEACAEIVQAEATKWDEDLDRECRAVREACARIATAIRALAGEPRS